MAGGWEQLRRKRTPGLLRPVAVIRACLLWSTFPKDFICILLAFERLFIVACTLCRSCPIARDSLFSSKLLVFLKFLKLCYCDFPLEGPEDSVRALDIHRMMTMWISFRKRVNSQRIVKLNPAQRQNVILPRVITAGTITRRAVEKTWLTAPNPKSNRFVSWRWETPGDLNFILQSADW